MNKKGHTSFSSDNDLSRVSERNEDSTPSTGRRKYKTKQSTVPAFPTVRAPSFTHATITPDPHGGVLTDHGVYRPSDTALFVPPGSLSKIGTPYSNEIVRTFEETLKFIDHRQSSSTTCSASSNTKEKQERRYWKRNVVGAPERARNRSQQKEVTPKRLEAKYDGKRNQAVQAKLRSKWLRTDLQNKKSVKTVSRSEKPSKQTEKCHKSLLVQGSPKKRKNSDIQSGQRSPVTERQKLQGTEIKDRGDKKETKKRRQKEEKLGHHGHHSKHQIGETGSYFEEVYRYGTAKSTADSYVKNYFHTIEDLPAACVNPFQDRIKFMTTAVPFANDDIEDSNISLLSAMNQRRINIRVHRVMKRTRGRACCLEGFT